MLLQSFHWLGYSFSENGLMTPICPLGHWCPLSIQPWPTWPCVLDSLGCRWHHSCPSPSNCLQRPVLILFNLLHCLTVPWTSVWPYESYLNSSFSFPICKMQKGFNSISQVPWAPTLCCNYLLIRSLTFLPSAFSTPPLLLQFKSLPHELSVILFPPTSPPSVTLLLSNPSLESSLLLALCSCSHFLLQDCFLAIL